MKNLPINHCAPVPSTQNGVALIEVLIVFFVLGIGLLGMAAMQMKSIQYNQNSYIRSQATVAAYDILDRMRLNKAVATSGGYDVAIGAAAPTGSALVALDLQDWKNFLSTSLPSGDGSVSCNASACTVQIVWFDRMAVSTTNPSGQMTGSGNYPALKVVSQL